VTEGGWFPFAWAVVPMVVGVMVLGLSRRWPLLRAHPLITAGVLLWLLIIASAADTPGSDLLTPMLGWIVSAAVSIATFLGLRMPARA
jgi:predicted Na+-dependent transporter